MTRRCWTGARCSPHREVPQRWAIGRESAGAPGFRKAPEGEARMPDQGNGTADLLGRLGTLTRNRYFYGKLLDACHLQLEQGYFNGKRWLLNRLALGSGVVCGLKLIPSVDGQGLQVLPGLAIDRLG